MRRASRVLPRLLALPGLLLALVVPALLPAPVARAAAFTEGTVVVYRVGDGVAPLNDTGNPVFLDEFDPDRPAGERLVQSLPLPTAPSGVNEENRPVLAADRVGEGLITRSVDGRSLIVTGFGAQSPVTPLANTPSSQIPRVIARVEANGTVNSSTALRDLADGSVPAGAASLNGFEFWAVGGKGGVRLALANAISSTQLVATPESLLQAAIFDGQLYASTAVGAGVRIGAVGVGVPTTGTQTLTPLPGLPATGVPFGFFLANLSPAVPGVDTLYVAYDDLGLSKFALVDGSWAARGTVGSGDDDYRGLTAEVSGETVTLYATREESELVRLTDSSGYGGTLDGAPTLLASAPAGTKFRGVALAPRPAELAPDLTVTLSGPASAVVNTAYAYALSVRNSGGVSASAVTVTLALPPGVGYLDAAGTGGFTASYSETARVVTFGGGMVGVDRQVDLLVSVSASAVGPVTVVPGAAVVTPVTGELNRDNNSSLQTVITSIVPEGGPSPDTTPPETTITGQPPASTPDPAATFTFVGDDDVTPAVSLIFQCSLDGAVFGPCASPQSYGGLAEGAHSFRVRAIDSAGNADPSPASYTWTVRGKLFIPLVARFYP